MKNILVPIGPSDNAVFTLQYAIDFAKEFNSNVYVMEAFSVVSAPSGALGNVADKVTESSKEHMKSVLAKVDNKGVAIKLVVYNGGVVDGIKGFDKELGIDLIIIASRSNSVNEEYYLGNTTGKIIKQTDIPALVIPMGAKYSQFDKIMTAFKSGVLKRNRILKRLQEIRIKFNSEVSLLLVKTPGYTDEDLRINASLMDLSSKVVITENATTFQGVLEHFQAANPDLLCVFRRKRGFFRKLWGKNTILKKEFFVPIPVLVLSVKKD